MLLSIDGPLQRLTLRPLYILLVLLVFLGSTVGLKYAVGAALKVEDDVRSYVKNLKLIVQISFRLIFLKSLKVSSLTLPLFTPDSTLVLPSLILLAKR